VLLWSLNIIPASPLTKASKPVSAAYQRDSHDAGPVLCGCKPESAELMPVKVPYTLLISLAQHTGVIFSETEHKEKRIHTPQKKNKPY